MPYFLHFQVSPGNIWAVECREEVLGSRMEVAVDITKYRVQPFKSYKVCVRLDDPSLGSWMTPTCTHLFSFERSVPYVDARGGNALLAEREMDESPNSQNVNAEGAPSADEKSRGQASKGRQKGGEANGKKILEGSDLTRVLNVTTGNKDDKEEEKRKMGNIRAKIWDHSGHEDKGRKVVYKKKKWEEGSEGVNRALVEDTQEFVRDGYHGKVERALGEENIGEKKSVERDIGEKDIGEKNIGEMDIRENKEKRSNGEILTSLAPLILVIISLL